MDKSWMENIIASESEKNQLQDWIKYNGLDRLKKIYEIARGDSACLTYYQMTECAKYDARLSRWLFKTARIVEGHMRAMLLNYTDWYDIEWKEAAFKRAFMEKFEPSINSVQHDDNTRRNINQALMKLSIKRMKLFSFSDFLDACSFAELATLHSLILNDDLYEGCVFKDRETRRTDLKVINSLRNEISHNHIILNSVFSYKELSYSLKQQIEILLSYIEDTAMRSRRIKELNGYATYDRNGTTMEIPEHYRIIIEE